MKSKKSSNYAIARYKVEPTCQATRKAMGYPTKKEEKRHGKH